jgi:GGDEF domain-containing protein
MFNLFSTVTKKVIVGYLVIVVFSLLAVGFALSRLHQQTQRSEQLVNVDFRSFELVRNLQQNLWAQENIEKQLLILRDPTLSELRLNRNKEFIGYALQLNELNATARFPALGKQVEKYRQANSELSEVLFYKDWEQAQQLSDEKTVPLRSQLLRFLAELREQQQRSINTGLASLSEATNQAYQTTVVLTLIGICLSAPVSLTVVLSIHRSVRALKEATRKMSAGSFEHRPDLSGSDEFAQLAHDFSRMGEKLRELEQLRLDANPLTQLPGNLAIDREIDRRIRAGEPFSHLYIDLDNFKVYSDRYGYNAGSNVLSKVGDLLQQVVRDHGDQEDLVGHIGGDDYVVLSTLARGETLAQHIITEFGELAPTFYRAEDREAGGFVGKDRFGIKRTFPLMTISIAVIHSDHYDYPSRLAISQDCARLKEYLKIQEGSHYMLERRREG